MALFGNSPDSDTMAEKMTSAPSSPKVNIIAEGTQIEGSISAESDIRVSGRVSGQLQIKGCCIVATEGSIEGEIQSEHAKIAGRVEGNLNVKERVFLSSSAVVEGTIKSSRLIVEEGATFNGECQMGHSGQIVKKESESIGSGTVAQLDMMRPDATRATAS